MVQSGNIIILIIPSYSNDYYHSLFTYFIIGLDVETSSARG